MDREDAKKVVYQYFDVFKEQGVPEHLYEGDRFEMKVAKNWNSIKEATVDLVYDSYSRAPMFIGSRRLERESKKYERGSFEDAVVEGVPVALGITAAGALYFHNWTFSNLALNAGMGVGVWWLANRVMKKLFGTPKASPSNKYTEVMNELNGRFSKRGLAKAYKTIHDASDELLLDAAFEQKYQAWHQDHPDTPDL